MIDPFRAFTRSLTALAHVQRDPRPGLLEPRPGAAHTAQRLDLGTPDRPIPAVWLRPLRPSGATVVYVHGAATSDLVPNAPLFDALIARGIGAVAFDLDGFGANPRPLEFPGCLEVLPQVLRAVRALDGVDPARVGLYGLSLGAAFGLRAVPTAPWLKALVLFGTPQALAVTDRERLAELLGTFHPLATPILLDAPTGHVARCFFEPVRFGDGSACIFDPDFVGRIDALAKQLDPLGAAAQAPPIPTRLLVGAWDALVPPADVRKLAAALPGETDVVEFPARNHTTLLYDRQAATSAADWFKRWL